MVRGTWFRRVVPTSCLPLIVSAAEPEYSRSQRLGSPLKTRLTVSSVGIFPCWGCPRSGLQFCPKRSHAVDQLLVVWNFSTTAPTTQTATVGWNV